MSPCRWCVRLSNAISGFQIHRPGLWRTRRPGPHCPPANSTSSLAEPMKGAWGCEPTGKPAPAVPLPDGRLRWRRPRPRPIRRRLWPFARGARISQLARRTGFPRSAVPTPGRPRRPRRAPARAAPPAGSVVRGGKRGLASWLAGPDRRGRDVQHHADLGRRVKPVPHLRQDFAGRDQRGKRTPDIRVGVQERSDLPSVPDPPVLQARSERHTHR